MDVLPSSDEIMTSETPSDLGCESTRTCWDVPVLLSAHETEVCNDVSWVYHSHKEAFTVFD